MNFQNNFAISFQNIQGKKYGNVLEMWLHPI